MLLQKKEIRTVYAQTIGKLTGVASELPTQWPVDDETLELIKACHCTNLRSDNRFAEP